MYSLGSFNWERFELFSLKIPPFIIFKQRFLDFGNFNGLKEVIDALQSPEIDSLAATWSVNVSFVQVISRLTVFHVAENF